MVFLFRVNCVCPGIIKTRFSEALWKDEELEKMHKRDIPLGYLGESEYVAGLVAFLASSDARFLTGEAILQDGGVTRVSKL